jgi:hypothetical protein
VADDEALTSLTIKATSTADATNSGTLHITITGGTTTWGGSGTQEDPYIIITPADLKAISDNDAYWNKHFKQGADIILTGNWKPIGSYDDGAFTGTYDGGGYKITNLKIDTTSDYQGLFGYIETGAVVKNVRLESCDITGQTDQFCIGGIVGFNGGTVENCYTTGSVKGDDCVGGIVGVNGGGIVRNCYTTCNVVSTYNAVGGVAGDNWGTVENCYAKGSVKGRNYVGGIVGSNSEGTVKKCYATGSVEGNDRVGGIVGSIIEGTVKNCVALNTGIKGTSYIGRVVGSYSIYNVPIMANNYGKVNMTGGTWNDTAKNGIDGKDVSLTTATAGISWWTTDPTGPGWSSSVWEWGNGKPKLVGLPE